MAWSMLIKKVYEYMWREWLALELDTSKCRLRVLEVLEYLLAVDGVVINAKYCNDVTPLHVACQMGHIDSVRKLIEVGAHVNFPDFRGDTPLHKCMNHPKVAKFLIENGAHVDVLNSDGRSPLHIAVRACCLETVCMLLYYNADTNIWDNYDFTPFMYAIQSGEIKIPRVLFEYADEINESDSLELAVRTNSPFIIDMVKDDPDSDSCDLFGCIEWPMRGLLKLVLKKLFLNKANTTVDLFSLFVSQVLCKEEVEDCIQLIIEGSNVEMAVESFTENDNFCFFVERFVGYGLKLEQLTILVCRLLEYGYRVTSRDIGVIFSAYGFCEVIQILLYMDNDYTKGWSYDIPVLCRLMFDLEYELCQHELCRNKVLKNSSNATLLEYFTYPPLMEKFVRVCGEENERSMVPSLIELSRDAVRRHIWNSLKVKNTCQFYTVTDNLKVPSSIMKILTFERKLYSAVN